MNDIPQGLTSARDLDLDSIEPITTQVQAWQNDYGSRVRFVETRGLPMVDLTLRFRAGTASDQALKGLAALTLYMLDEGSDGLNAAQLDSRMQALGAIVGKEIRLDHASVSLRTLSAPDILAPAVALLTTMLAKPDFPSAALQTVKAQLNAHDGARRNTQYWQPSIALHRHLYSGHPYATALSIPEDIERITVDDLRGFHRRAYSASNLDIAIVGDLSREDAIALAQGISSALPQGWAAAALAEVPEPQAATLHVAWDSPNALASITLPMNVPANEAEHLPLTLANEVLGGGLESRLMKELRQRLDLTYDIRSTYKVCSAASRLSIQWDSRPEQLQSSVERVEALLRTYVHEGPNADELRRARQKLAGECLREVATNATLVERLAYLGSHDLPDDYLNTYMSRLHEQTPAIIGEVIRRRFDLERKVLITVGMTPELGSPAVPPGDQ